MIEAHYNAPLERQSRELQQRSYVLNQMQQLGLWLCGVVLLLLLVLLTACAHQQPTPCEPLKPMPLPAVEYQPPKEPYSLSAAALFKRWRQMLDSAAAPSN